MEEEEEIRRRKRRERTGTEERNHRAGDDRGPLTADLEDDGVEVEFLELVKERNEFGLLLCRRGMAGGRPVDIGHRCHPRRAELSLRS